MTVPAAPSRAHLSSRPESRRLLSSRSAGFAPRVLHRGGGTLAATAVATQSLEQPPAHPSSRARFGRGICFFLPGAPRAGFARGILPTQPLLPSAGGAAHFSPARKRWDRIPVTRSAVAATHFRPQFPSSIFYFLERALFHSRRTSPLLAVPSALQCLVPPGASASLSSVPNPNPMENHHEHHYTRTCSQIRAETLSRHLGRSHRLTRRGPHPLRPHPSHPLVSPMTTALLRSVGLHADTMLFLCSGGSLDPLFFLCNAGTRLCSSISPRGAFRTNLRPGSYDFRFSNFHFLISEVTNG